MDEKGVAVSLSGDYFIDVAGLRPGDVITKKLTIRNRSKGSPVRLTMTSEPGKTSGPVNLLDMVSMELLLDGTSVYKGKLSGGNDMAGPGLSEYPLGIGVYSGRTEHRLIIRLVADDSFSIGYKKSEAYFRLAFHAERGVQEKPGGQKGRGSGAGGHGGSPKTGDALPYYALLASLLLSACGVALCVMKMRGAGRRIVRLRK